MNKIIGLGLVAAGAVAFLLSYPGIQKMVNVTIPASWNNYVMVVGVALAIAGLAFIKPSSSSRKTKQAAEEVPIYHGHGKNRQIVGYQRVSK